MESSATQSHTPFRREGLGNPARAPVSAGTTLVLVATIITVLACSTPALSQDVKVSPMGSWLEHRQAIYRGKPLIVHLRAGYERAVLFPEPVQLTDSDQTLPDCDLVIDEEVLGFYPKRSFDTRILKLTGIETGTRFELHIRSSPSGIRQPLQINYASERN